MKMPWGKYVGKDITELPFGYLAWVWEESGLDAAGKSKVRREMLRRLGADAAPISPAKHSGVWDSVQAMLRRLMLRHHPDRGGSEAAMTVVNEMREEMSSLRSLMS